jgi:hypothetical protein
MAEETRQSTAKDVAEWMAAELERTRELDQETAVDRIARLFGKEFTYTNENGNPAIDRRVLKEFRKLSEDYVVWDQGERMWRKRGKI